MDVNEEVNLFKKKIKQNLDRCERKFEELKFCEHGKNQGCQGGRELKIE